MREIFTFYCTDVLALQIGFIRSVESTGLSKIRRPPVFE